MNEVDGRMLNAEPSPDDPRDVPFLGNAARGLPLLELPTSFRRSGLGPVLNQHKTGTCGGHAGIGLRGWQEKLEGHEITDFDPFGLYDLCLKADGHSDPHRMTGTTARTVMNVLKKTGTPLKDGGLAGKIAAYESIADPSEEAIKEAILTNGVLLVRCDWDAGWGQSSLLPGRIVPAPTETMGGHIFLLFGWDDEVNGGSFLMRNSWGSGSQRRVPRPHPRRSKPARVMPTSPTASSSRRSPRPGSRPTCFGDLSLRGEIAHDQRSLTMNEDMGRLVVGLRQWRQLSAQRLKRQRRGKR